MIFPSTERYFRIFLYGCGAALLIIDILFLFRAITTNNFVPIVPILTGILAALGLILIVWSEGRARREDKRDHLRISRVAHQLENPLKSLRQDLDNLLADAEALPASARLQLKQMATNSSVVLDNIQRLFLTLRAQQSSVVRDLRTHDLCALTAEAVDNLHAQASARNVTINLQQHCRSAPVKVDRAIFLTALNMLLDNAINYTQTPGLVNVSVIRSRHTVRVVLQDRGIGITPADAPLIERPFARGENAAKYNPAGIGLGVALAKLIARQLGGKLTWRSRAPQAGAEFAIHLPLVQK